MRKTFTRCRLRTEKGFILAEVMLAIFIMSVALVAISAMFIQAIQAGVMANHYTVAANLAQKQLELLKIHPPEYWTGITLPAVILWGDPSQIPSLHYTLTTNAIPSAINSHLIQVTVIASWQERNVQCSVQFVTLYSAL